MSSSSRNSSKSVSRASHLPSVGPFAEPASVSRMFPSGSTEIEGFHPTNLFENLVTSSSRSGSTSSAITHTSSITINTNGTLTHQLSNGNRDTARQKYFHIGKTGTHDNNTIPSGCQNRRRIRKKTNVVVADEGPSPFTCNTCGLTLHSRTGLKNHIMQKHKGKRVVKCPHCEKAFTRPSQLKKHIDSSHDERTGEYYCDKCTFKHRDVEIYNQHMRLHKLCKYCRNEFSQLTRHEPKCPYKPPSP